MNRRPICLCGRFGRRFRPLYDNITITREGRRAELCGLRSPSRRVAESDEIPGVEDYYLYWGGGWEGVSEFESLVSPESRSRMRWWTDPG
jgi:hypothetical protein